jgi:hypothetical protein
MQTFMPYSDPKRVAEVLDDTRLRKQVIEAIQIANCLLGISSTGWCHHPAVKMWKDNVEYLVYDYTTILLNEQLSRGHNCNTVQQSLNTLKNIVLCTAENRKAPSWMSLKEIHLSHRANLLRKMPERYRKFWPNECDDIQNYWPTKHLEN